MVNRDHVQEANREDLGFVIRNGIVVVIKNATIPDGMVI
jgi:glucose-1-phosphate adenylyltransferase